jgi:Outer membrane protein beta-barrel domain
MKKKILLAAIAITCIVNIGKSQRTSFGFAAGATFSNIYAEVDGERDHGKIKPGLTFGAVADISLGNKCSFQPALNFVQKGTKDEDEDYGEKMKLNFNYLELPLNLLYKGNSGGGHFFVGGGPAVSYALSGKSTYEYNGDKEKQSIHFGGRDNDDFKAFDFSLNGLIGFQASSGVFVAFNYTHGLGNLFINGSDDGKLRNTSFGLKIGYLLSHVKK